MEDWFLDLDKNGYNLISSSNEDCLSNLKLDLIAKNLGLSYDDFYEHVNYNNILYINKKKFQSLEVTIQNRIKNYSEGYTDAFRGL